MKIKRLISLLLTLVLLGSLVPALAADAGSRQNAADFKYAAGKGAGLVKNRRFTAVSYTHLTLPTIA